MFKTLCSVCCSPVLANDEGITRYYVPDTREIDELKAELYALKNAVKVKMKPGRKPTLGDYCRNGHLRTPQNCGRNTKGTLICRACSKANFKRFMEKNKK